MKKLINMILSLFLVYIALIWDLFASIQTEILPTDKTIITNTDWGTVLISLLAYAKDFIFWVLMLIAIWVFLYIWFKLITAKWNQEELTKALKAFTYAVVGIAFVWLAWALVTIASSLNI